MQIEPGPIPTLTTSAPQSIKAFVASAVATLPATKGSDGYKLLIFLTLSNTNCEWPCAVSIVIISTFALTSSATLSIELSPTPTAAPTKSLPFLSFAELGY